MSAVSFADLFGDIDAMPWRECEAPGCKLETLGELCSAHYAEREAAAALNRAERSAIERVDERYRSSAMDLRVGASRIRGTIRFRDDPPGADGLPPRVGVREAVQRITESQRPVVTIMGDAGSGKSTLAAMAYRSMLYKANGAVRFCDWYDAVDLGSAALESALGGVPVKVERARRAELLVVDELRDPKHGNKASNVFGVINDRHRTSGERNGKDGPLTLVTTGMDPDQITDVLGSGGHRRLVESHSALVITMRLGGK